MANRSDDGVVLVMALPLFGFEHKCDLLCFISEIGQLLIKQRAVFAGIISENGRKFRGICQPVF